MLAEELRCWDTELQEEVCTLHSSRDDEKEMDRSFPIACRNKTLNPPTPRRRTQDLLAGVAIPVMMKTGRL